jgi:serine/threonine protein kinase
MLTGDSPFRGKSVEKTREAITNCQFKIPKTVSDVASDFINKLLQPEAEKRLGNGSILDLKAHPLFTEFDFSQLYRMRLPMDLELNRE